MQRCESKHNWNPGAVWLRKMTQNLPTSCTNYRLNSHDQISRLYLWNIKKDFESSHKRKCNTSDNCAHWRQKHTGVGPECVGSCPRRVRWTVTPIQEKDADISDSRKIFTILIFWHVLQFLLGFCFSFFHFSLSSAVVINFINTIKSN